MNKLTERLKILRDNALERWVSLNQRQKYIVMGSGAAVMLAMLAMAAYLVLNAGSSNMQPLFTNLEPDDAAAIVSELKGTNTKYTIADDGATILVPRSAVLEKRMAFAEQGLPTGGTVGYELFDTTKLGVTDFTQKVNLSRAKNGELARTIMSLEAIDNARVMIVEPEDSLFTVEDKEPSASVALQIKQGKSLEQSQVRGIMHLVASSIEDLDPQNVTVVDAKGEILSDLDEKSRINEKLKMTELQLKYKKELEGLYEKKIMAAMSKVFGQENVVVVVSAELDFDVHTTEEEVYTPYGDTGKGIVRSEQVIKEKYLGTGTVPEIGVPGTTSNIPGYKGLAEGNAQYDRSEETRNMEISRLQEYKEHNQGNIKRLSVAVMIDDEISYEQDDEGQDVPYISRRRISDIQSIVTAAANLETAEDFGVKARGDQVSVIGIKFTPESDGMAREIERQLFWQNVKNWVTYILLIVIVLGVVILSIIALRASVVKEELPEEIDYDSELEEPVPVEEMLIPELTDEQRERERIKAEVLRMISDDPEGAALIVRSWLFDEPES